MKSLLDTNTCIRFLNQRSQALIDRLTDTPDEDVIVCSVVKAEMFYGVVLSICPKKLTGRREDKKIIDLCFLSSRLPVQIDTLPSMARESLGPASRLTRTHPP